MIDVNAHQNAKSSMYELRQLEVRGNLQIKGGRGFSLPSPNDRQRPSRVAAVGTGNSRSDLKPHQATVVGVATSASNTATRAICACTKEAGLKPLVRIDGHSESERPCPSLRRSPHMGLAHPGEGILVTALPKGSEGPADDHDMLLRELTALGCGVGELGRSRQGRLCSFLAPRQSPQPRRAERTPVLARTIVAAIRAI